MAIDAEARITFRGVPQARAAMRAVSKERSDAAKAMKKAAQDQAKAEREQQRAAERAAKAARAAAAATAKATKKASEDSIRSSNAELKARMRNADQLRIRAERDAELAAKAAKRLADARIREERRASSVATREAARRLSEEKRTLEAQRKAHEDHARRGRGFLGGVVGAAVGGAMGASSTARGIGGIRSMPERIQAANEFRERLTIASSQANLTPEEKAKAESQINAASMATGKDQGELLGVLETGQAKFNDLRFFADNLKEIATIARASGADAGEFAQALGFTRQAFGLTGPEAMEAAKLMVAAASKGSIEVKDFASSFAPVAGLFAQSTGLKGLEGVRQFLGTSQAAGTLGKSADETATLVERFIAALADPEVAKDLRAKTGVKIKGATPQQVIEQLAGNKRFAKPGVMQDVFKDIREQQAVTALMAAHRRTKAGQEGAIDIGAIASVDASAGAAITAKTMGELEGSGALAFDRKNAELQAHTLANLASYNDQLLKVVDVSTKLEMSFDKLALWSQAIAGTGIGGLVGGLAAGGGLSGAGGASAGGKMLGGLGKAVTTLGPALGILGGGAAIATALYESGAGDAAGNWLFDLFNPDVAKLKNQGPTGDVKVGAGTVPSNVVPIRPDAATAPSASAPAAQQSRDATALRLVKEGEKQTRLLEQIAANGKPPPFPGDLPRSPR